MKYFNNPLKRRIMALGFLGILVTVGIEGLVINQKNKEINSLQVRLEDSNTRCWDLAEKYAKLDSSKFADSAKLVLDYSFEILSLQRDYLDLASEKKILEEEYMELAKKSVEKSKQNLELLFNLMESNTEKEYYKEFLKYLDSSLDSCLFGKLNEIDYF